MSALPQDNVLAEPYKLKIVQPTQRVAEAVRRQALKRAFYNVYLLPSEHVYVDLLTETGTGAMSDRQWAGLMIGDEAYAGSRNFFRLQRATQEVLGLEFVVPTHNGRGAEHLVANIKVKAGNYVATNWGSPSAIEHFKRAGAEVYDISGSYELHENFDFKGDVDVERLEALIHEVGPDRISFAHVKLCVGPLGSHPVSLANLKSLRDLTGRRHIPLVLDLSYVAENAWFAREREQGYSNKTVASIVKETANLADIVILNCREACYANVGALIATNDAAFHQEVRALVVVFEGLFTYGGLNGRDMEAIATGLHEMVDENNLRWNLTLLRKLSKLLQGYGLPVLLPEGANGVYVDAKALLGEAGPNNHPARALAAFLYATTGVRVAVHDPLFNGYQHELLALLVPKRCYTTLHVEYAAEALRYAAKNAKSILGLRLISPQAHFLDARFSIVGTLPRHVRFHAETVPEPYRVKAVESIATNSRGFREKAIKEAGYNTFLLRSEDVYIDLLTDSGTSAMSDHQWAGVMRGDERVGSSNFKTLQDAVQEVLGYRYVVPTHQGRAAEHILSQSLIRKGQFVPMNMYFTTTREHIEMAGGTYVDVIIEEAKDAESRHPFKGNVDLKKLRRVIEEKGEDEIAYVSIAPEVNMAAGQPFSISNIKQVSKLCHDRGILLIYDATRCAENAWLIKDREPRYHNKSVKEILKEMMSYSDGCTMSGKKDCLGNIGGFIGINSRRLYERFCQMVSIYEGTRYDGGMSGRDMEALARGVYEMIDDEYIGSRVRQVQYLGKLLLDAKVPIVEPVGGFAVCLDAKRFLPHIPQDEFPAQMLAAQLYVDSGVRSMERGVVSAGRDHKTGRHKYPQLELVRLTIPRRVYTSSHMDVVARSVVHLHNQRATIGGLKMTYEPPQLRFFSARFEPLERH
jgi:tyrosine phenol-lyase